VSWPEAYEIHIAYLVEFIEEFGATKTERARELCEEALAAAPRPSRPILYQIYVELEEQFGLGRNVVRVLERAFTDARRGQKSDICCQLLRHTTALFGIPETRATIERCIQSCHYPPFVVRIGQVFINLERKLGETERARALYRYVANYTDPGTPGVQTFWESWSEFELVYGTEGTYIEMKKVARLMESKFSVIPSILQ
ncbi:MAG: hypothetical protein V2I33_20335, partial [Kangiellaceae bacterium]|nr:hypothetical protein [Kangiellaceae bacterium]